MKRKQFIKLLPAIGFLPSWLKPSQKVINDRCLEDYEAAKAEYYNQHECKEEDIETVLMPQPITCDDCENRLFDIVSRCDSCEKKYQSFISLWNSHLKDATKPDRYGWFKLK